MLPLYVTPLRQQAELLAVNRAGEVNGDEKRAKSNLCFSHGVLARGVFWHDAFGM
jgi:hypothetical protein